MPVRLHKHLAACGVGSRRQCEELMRQGRVTVDGEVVTEPGWSFEPAGQDVRVNGEPVSADVVPVYIALNKPPGYVCTAHDPQGRPKAIDLVPATYGRIHNVGRLDADSEGLLLLTNDGEFTNRLSHPRYHVAKTYQLWLREPLPADAQEVWRQGIIDRGERLAVKSVRAVSAGRAGHAYEIVLGEGRNRHIRRMAAACGATVLRLKRIAVGTVRLGSLKRGAWRQLGPDEVASLIGKSARPPERGTPSPRTSPRR